MLQRAGEGDKERGGVSEVAEEWWSKQGQMDEVTEGFERKDVFFKSNF